MNSGGDLLDLPGGANRVMVHRCTSMHDADFDPSRENLMRLFQLLDSNGSGLLTQSKLEVRVHLPAVMAY